MKRMSIMRRALQGIAGFQTVLILAIAGCRGGAPISGTPPSDAEASALKSGGEPVRREQNVYSERGADVIASTRKIVADLAALLRAAEQPYPPVILIGEVVNSTSLPAASFNTFKRQLIDNLRAAATEAHLVLVTDSKAGSAGDSAPQFVLRSEVFDFKSREGRTYLVDYELRRVEPGGQAVAASPVLWAKRYRVSGQ